MPLRTMIHSISLSFLCCYVSLSTLFPFFLSIHPWFPGQGPEKTLDLDGAPALRLHSSMVVVMGVEEVDGGDCVCVF